MFSPEPFVFIFCHTIFPPVHGYTALIHTLDVRFHYLQRHNCHLKDARWNFAAGFRDPIRHPLHLDSYCQPVICVLFELFSFILRLA